MLHFHHLVMSSVVLLLNLTLGGAVQCMEGTQSTTSAQVVVQNCTNTSQCLLVHFNYAGKLDPRNSISSSVYWVCGSKIVFVNRRTKRFCVYKCVNVYQYLLLSFNELKTAGYRI